MFQKAAPIPSGTDLVHPATGAPIVPESPEALTLSFVALRDDLKVAQSQDPKLVQIINVLKKKLLGEFIADTLGPSREVKKARARASHFKLAADGVLLGKLEEHSEFLPCVPDVKYLGASRTKDAPGNMTWKHLLLAAVHNTHAAPHLHAKDNA